MTYSKVLLLTPGLVLLFLGVFLGNLWCPASQVPRFPYGEQDPDIRGKGNILLWKAHLLWADHYKANDTIPIL